MSEYLQRPVGATASRAFLMMQTDWRGSSSAPLGPDAKRCQVQHHQHNVHAAAACGAESHGGMGIGELGDSVDCVARLLRPGCCHTEKRGAATQRKRGGGI